MLYNSSRLNFSINKIHIVLSCICQCHACSSLPLFFSLSLSLSDTAHSGRRSLNTRARAYLIPGCSDHGVEGASFARPHAGLWVGLRLSHCNRTAPSVESGSSNKADKHMCETSQPAALCERVFSSENVAFSIMLPKLPAPLRSAPLLSHTVAVIQYYYITTLSNYLLYLKSTL